jgi:hypothetical protein
MFFIAISDAVDVHNNCSTNKYETLRDRLLEGVGGGGGGREG